MKYRIFKLTSRYEVDGVEDMSTYSARMVRDEDDVEAMKVKWREDAKEGLLLKHEGKQLTNFSLEIEQRPKRRSWALGWFNHYTFRSDDLPDRASVLASFEEYVEEVEREFPQDLMISPLPEGYICLMGAEDRWRWKGETQDHEAPCECEHCVKQGVWRINH